MKQHLSLIFFLCAGLLAGGCGYSTKSMLPPHLKTIYVEAFKNNIVYASEGNRNLYFPLLEVKARDAIINRYLFDGNVKIADAGKADMTLSGEVVNYYRSALRRTDDDDAEEYRVYVAMHLVMYDNAKDEIIWEEDGFTGEAEYFVRGALTTTEESAVQEAVLDLARRVVERTIENW